MSRAEMLKEADRLHREQVRLRGTQPWPGLDHKPTRAPGDYDPSPENEARASTIIWLRRQAAEAPRRHR